MKEPNIDLSDLRIGVEFEIKLRYSLGSIEEDQRVLSMIFREYVSIRCVMTSTFRDDSDVTPDDPGYSDYWGHGDRWNLVIETHRLLELKSPILNATLHNLNLIEKVRRLVAKIGRYTFHIHVSHRDINIQNMLYTMRENVSEDNFLACMYHIFSTKKQYCHLGKYHMKWQQHKNVGSVLYSGCRMINEYSEFHLLDISDTFKERYAVRILLGSKVLGVTHRERFNTIEFRTFQKLGEYEIQIIIEVFYKLLNLYPTRRMKRRFKNRILDPLRRIHSEKTMIFLKKGDTV